MLLSKIALRCARAPSRGFSLERFASTFRNVAIVAHVDHGKTTLVDALLRQCLGKDANDMSERAMDSNDQERERGITILSKNTSMQYGDVTLNIVDTPGHADFGGEVERVLSMVDGVCLLVDATEGPMTQTKFVLRKALAAGLQPIVVLNKVDRPTARADEVEGEVLDLFCELDASDSQLDYPVLLSSGRDGWARREGGADSGDMSPLLDALVEHCPEPSLAEDAVEAPFSMLVSIMESDPTLYMATKVLLTGLVVSGEARAGDVIHALEPVPGGGDDGGAAAVVVGEPTKIAKIFTRRGVERHELPVASAGNIVTLAGVSCGRVGHTLCDPAVHVAHPAPSIDPPTLSMNFSVNDSPGAGRNGGTKLTTPLIREWLEREAESNVAIEVSKSESDTRESFEVRGRGEMQLGILIESMRRDGFELSVSPPRVLLSWSEEHDAWHEPEEEVVVDVDSEWQGTVIEAMAARCGELQSMEAVDSSGSRQRLAFVAPSRGLVGLRSMLRRTTHGDAVVNSTYRGTMPIRQDLSRVRQASPGYWHCRRRALHAEVAADTTRAEPPVHALDGFC